MAKYIFVGADPQSTSTHHGGVLTLSAGLIEHAKRQGHEVQVINTLRPGFDVLPLRDRLRAGFGRAAQLYRALRVHDCAGVIIVSGAGFSFYERILLSAISRWFGVTDLFLIVDGWFYQKLRAATGMRRWWFGTLLRVPRTLAASGRPWRELFTYLGVEPQRIVSMHYWLSASFGVADRAKEAVDGRPLRFFFVGWMIREKGVYELLAAIQQLRHKHRFSFTFIGGGTLLEEVRRKIREAGWEDSVSALGWVPNEEFERLLAAADVFVLPSYAEGFPMTLIEAFSKGVPAICSDVGGISDSLRDDVNGYLIPPRQVVPLVAAMERYLVNPHLIPEHSRAALAAVAANHEARVNCELIFDVFR